MWSGPATFAIGIFGGVFWAGCGPLTRLELLPLSLCNIVKVIGFRAPCRYTQPTLSEAPTQPARTRRRLPFLTTTLPYAQGVVTTLSNCGICANSSIPSPLLAIWTTSFPCKCCFLKYVIFAGIWHTTCYRPFRSSGQARNQRVGNRTIAPPPEIFKIV